MVEPTPSQGDLARAALKPFAVLKAEIEHCAAESGVPVEGWAMPCSWDDLLRASEAYDALAAGTIAPLGSSAASVREAVEAHWTDALKDREAIAGRLRQAFPDLTDEEALAAAEGAFPECLLEPEALARLHPAPAEDGGKALATGFVVANGLDGAGQRFRAWGDCGPVWTADIDTALQFLRRDDAEQFAAEDEDAWRILPLAAAPALAPVAGERVRHVKRGTEYEVLHRGVELRQSSPLVIHGGNGEPYDFRCGGLAVYRDEDGKLWAREEDEFDGFFEALSASPAPTEPEGEGQDQGATLAGQAGRLRPSPAVSALSGDHPSRGDLQDFLRRTCASRLQHRIDAMDERGLESVGISRGFARDLLQALATEQDDDEDAAYEHMNAVSARVQQDWDADEAVFDDARLRFLERQARASRTGISFDYVPSVEGEPSGFRFMRRFFVGGACRTLRAAIDRAMAENPGHKTDRALCVSDQSGEAGTTEGRDPKDASAVGAAETPNRPDPNPRSDSETAAVEMREEGR